MEDQETKALKARVADLESKLAAGPVPGRGVRKRSSRILFGLGLWRRRAGARLAPNFQ